MTAYNFTGKRVLVTGASHGIGAGDQHPLAGEIVGGHGFRCLCRSGPC